MSRVLAFTGQNIRRTPYQALTASMVMFLTFLALTIFLLLAVASQKILIYYESKPQAIAFFKDNTPQSDIAAIENALKQTGKITSLTFITKEEALSVYRERNKDKPALLELVSANILPSSLEISTVTPEDLGPIAEILKKEPVVEEVVYPEDVIKSLSNATRFIRYVGGGAVSFLIIFSTLIILTIIGFKIRLRRKEIEIMRLLGASTWFIRGPFIVEGITYAVLGAVFAWITTYLLLWYSTPFIPQGVEEIKLLPIAPTLMLTLLGVELIVAIIIGGLGSFGAVRRYLRI